MFLAPLHGHTLQMPDTEKYVEMIGQLLNEDLSMVFGVHCFARLFSFVALKWWIELPLTNRTAETLAVFKWRWKTRLFTEHIG